jgi:hypothetical protein
VRSYAITRGAAADDAIATGATVTDPQTAPRRSSKRMTQSFHLPPAGARDRAHMLDMLHPMRKRGIEDECS